MSDRYQESQNLAVYIALKLIKGALPWKLKIA